MKITIEQVNKAWIEFNKPMWMIGNKQLDPDKIKYGVIEVDQCSNAVQIEPREDFISFLIDYISRKRGGKQDEK